MIRKIGVLCQDRNSLGFLLGLQRRLACEAKLVEPTIGSLSKSTTMTRGQARLAVGYFRKIGVDLIIRFTDADKERWQNVRRHEGECFQAVESIFVCGVAVNNTEQWLALDLAYLSGVLDIRGDMSTADPDERTGIIKKAVVKARTPDEPLQEVVARIVANAPTEVFRRWLRADESLCRFYQDCRAAAQQARCDVPNELENQ